MSVPFGKRVKGERIAALLLCVTAMLMVIFNPFDKTTESIFLSLLIIAVSIIPFFVWKKRKDRDVVILGVLFYGFFHLVGYGFVGFLDHAVIFTGLLDNVSDRSDAIAKTLVLVHLLIVFGSLFVLQILFKSPELVRTPNPKGNVTRYRFSFVICVFLTFVEFLRVSGVPPFSMMGGIIVSLVRFLAFMYLFYFLFYLDFGGWTIKILAIIGCLMGQGALVGITQAGPYIEVGLILILISIQKGRIPLSPIVLLLLTFIIYQPMKGVVRNVFDDEGGEASVAIVCGLAVIEDVEFRTLIDVASRRVDYNLLLSSLVNTIGVPNEDDYLGWKAYENVLYLLIPRIVWPDKPNDNFSNEWGVQEGYLNSTDRVTSYNLPWLPQMYLSAGIVGVIVGSFVVGIILYLLQRYYWTIKPDAWTFAVGYSIMRAMMHLESDFGMSFGIAIKIILIDMVVRVIRSLLIKNKENKIRGSHRLVYGLKKIT